MESIINKRGRILINQKLIIGADGEFLREFFSNFFPISANTYHKANFNESIEYFGYSPHFEELSDGEIIPNYVLNFESDKKGVMKFKSVVRTKGI